MKRNTLIALFAALALSIPAVMTTGVSEAHAQGSVINSASKDGKRTHKRAGAKRTKESPKKSSKNKKKSTSRSRTQTTTRTSASAPAGYQATETRVYRSSGSSSRATSYRSSRSRTTTTYRRSRPAYTEVHHHHRSVPADHGQPATRTSSRSTIDAYITGGVGVSGFASNTISDDALPGIGWNVAIGGKGEYLGMELGLDGGGYTFDPQGTNETQLGLFGVYFDLKLQPTIANIFEPYVFAGLGGYVLSDAILVENTGGGAYRLGLGANLRFDSIAIGGKYLYQGFGFTDDTGIYGGDFGGASETVSLGLTIYF